MHRVFPSSHNNSASSQRIQFHGVHFGDSWEVVTPFMQVWTYQTRDFATLGPSGLRPPFTVPLIQDKYLSSYKISAGQVSDPILHLTILQSLVFLLNSRYPLETKLIIIISNNIVLLFPKLRSYFAEFLQNDSLQRLGILYQFTCVSLGTVLKYKFFLIKNYFF